ncbi:hypothetical protein [Aeromicrobium terrae]|uniref:hypothetical protein n=1 Tax=Aeromicrobium terrae TaxID=2498846 RepID=UPI00164EF4F9|nr:hypothetical protein [Aeromicrobium terrae]
MFKKSMLLIAGAAGYVLGARAGRERYDQIKEHADRLVNNPTVQKAASDAKDVVAEKAPVVKEKVADATSSEHSADSPDVGPADLPGTATNPAHANV